MVAPGQEPPGGSDDFHRGEQIGKYQIITQLSVGGMAELFLGFTAGPGGFRKYVAIKRILPEVRSNAAFERMFLDEARITAAFNHPNIAQVYELGQQEDGLFLAMEFVAGQNLDQLTSAYRRRQEPIPLGLSVAVMRDVCLALHYAHTFTDPSGRPSPIIHRDVAQKNIMVTYDGGVKLLDFGIAKARNSLERTHVGTVKGTSGYMSPEQVRGDPLDGRSDVFSVGVVLWELITGQRLFAASSEREEMMSVLKAPIPPLRHPSTPVSESLSGAILKALERDVKDRFSSAKELARALEQAASSELFDTDRRALVMRELFEKKMNGTRALLESAQEPVHKSTLILEEPVAPMLVKPAPAPVDTAPTEREVPAPDTRVSPRTVPEPAPESSQTLNTVLWGIALVSIVIGGSYLVLLLTHKLNEGVKPEPTVKTYTDPRLKLFPEPVPPGMPVDGAGDAGVAGSTAAADGQGAQPGPAAKEADDKPSRASRVAQGKLTLIIMPEAQVFLGKRSLGKTPLFNAPMPVGTNLLHIVGPDKKRRVLSVPIEAGKTTMHRFSLNDIPEAH